MGNCAASRHAGESWADDGEWADDASSSSSTEEGHHRHHAPEEHMSEVTIRITKRQLHELMEKEGANGRGIKSQELLAGIMYSGEVHHHDLHREAHWKPALRSIPEAVEHSASSSVHDRD